MATTKTGKRKSVPVLAVAIAMLTVAVIISAFLMDAFSSLFGSRNFVYQKSFGDYELRIYNRQGNDLKDKLYDKWPSLANRLFGDPTLSTVEIFHRGTRVHRQTGYRLWPACIESKGPKESASGQEINNADLVVGRDITGDGIPDIAIEGDPYMVGGHKLYIFSCGNDFCLVATIDSFEEAPELVDMDGDGIPEVIVSDNAFYHFFGDEDIMQVVLRWKKDRYVAAKDLMFQKPPTPEALAQMAAELKADPSWDAGNSPGRLWRSAVRLMYGGHEELGWKLIADSWRPGFGDTGDMTKKEIIGYCLAGKLAESIYWPNLKTVSVTNLFSGITDDGLRDHRSGAP